MRLSGVSLTRFAAGQMVKYRYWYLAAVGALVATHWIQSHLPFWAKELVENREVSYIRFLWPALGILLFRSLSRILFFHPARLTERDFRVDLLSRLQDTSPLRYRQRSEGQIFQILSMDIEQVRSLLGFVFLQAANIVVALAVLVPKLWSFDPRLLPGMLPMFIALGVFSVVVGRNHILYRRIQNLQGELQNLIMESYEGKRTIKNFHSEDSFVGLFQERSGKELEIFSTASSRVAFSMPLIPLGVGLALVWGAHIIFSAQLGVGSLILFSGFVFLFLEPLSYVSWMGMVMARTVGSWDRIQEFLAELACPIPEEKQTDLNFWGKTLSLDFKPAHWSVLVGATGHGKSHLLEQTARLLKREGREVAYVAQSPYLYNDTLGANIFLGRDADEISRSRARVLLDIFDLGNLVGRGKDILSLEVGEHGKRLSGGQIKRLALVRSLMVKADFLVWDDPFSSVDVVLEKQIVRDLRELDELKEKTLILSSHRLSMARKCDTIILLEKFKGVVEKGPPWELLTEGKETYEHFSKQIV